MTAEVAVMNRSAVALAADSFVTIERQQGDRKTYNVNKLFTLSKHAPVGVMIYGNADLTEVPWETIVKVYRKDLGKQTFPTIQEYAEHFVDYLSKSTTLFPKQSQEGWMKFVVRSVFFYLSGKIDKEVEEETRAHGTITPAKVETIVAKHIKEHYEEWTKAPARTLLPPSFEENLKEAIQREIDSFIKDTLEDKPLTTTARRQLEELAVLLFMKDDDLPGSDSGVVIAGFGDNERYPVVRAYKLHGVCCNQLVYSYSERESFVDPGCAVLTFAQKDVADLFLRGIDNHNFRILTRYMRRVLSQLSNSFVDESNGTDDEKNALRVKLQSASDSAMTTLTESFLDHLQEEHIDPLTRAVSVLPKEELASLAESLVSLTSLKRKLSDEIETVGGPIDVAIITKGDGFVWIRRKHYFDPNINPVFVQKYLEG